MYSRVSYLREQTRETPACPYYSTVLHSQGGIGLHVCQQMKRENVPCICVLSSGVLLSHKEEQNLCEGKWIELKLIT